MQTDSAGNLRYDDGTPVVGRPLPDMSAAVTAFLDKMAAASVPVLEQIGGIVTQLGNGASIGIRPAPALWPQWEIQLRLVPKK